MKKTIILFLILLTSKIIFAETINDGPKEDYLKYLTAVEQGDWDEIRKYIWVDKSFVDQSKGIEDIDIYIAYNDALGGIREGYNRDMLRRDLVEEMGGKEDIDLFVRSVQGNTAREIKVEDEKIEGNKATLFVKGWRSHIGESQGVINFIKDGDTWKIAKEIWEQIIDSQKKMDLLSLSDIENIAFAFCGDGGTISIEIEDINGKRFLVSLDRQMTSKTQNCFYVGASHPTETNARMIKVGGEEEQALAKKLDLWLDKNVGGAEERRIIKEKERNSYQGKGLPSERYITEDKAHTIIELLEVLNDLNRPDKSNVIQGEY